MSDFFSFTQLFKPHGPALNRLVIASIFGAVIQGLMLWFLHVTLEETLFLRDTGHLASLSLMLFVLFGCSLGVQHILSGLSNKLVWEMVSSVRLRLHRHLLALSPNQHGSVGEQVTILSHDMDQFQHGALALLYGFRGALTVLALVAVCFLLVPSFTVFLVFFLPLGGLASWWNGRRLRALATRVRSTRASFNRLVHEQLSGLQAIQVFQAEDGEHSRFVRAEESDAMAQRQMVIRSGVPDRLTQLVVIGAVLFLYRLGGEWVLNNQLEPSKLLTFLVGTVLLYVSFDEVLRGWSVLQRSSSSLERVYAALELDPIVVEPEYPIPLPPGHYDLTWEGVTVDYGFGVVLNQIDLVVKSGEMVALVGPTGAGKTTLLKLASRQIEADLGEVYLGGIPIADVSKEALRRTIAMVPQDDFLFARSIAENLRLAKPSATWEEMVKALKIAGATSIVDRLPAGLDSTLESYSILSGGERQRLCVARALLCEAPILLLDEPSNQVDTRTEADILRRLQERERGRSVVLVAHNLRAARVADRVVVVDKGQIVEQGTHDELVNAGGLYQRLWSIPIGGVDE